MGRSQNTVIESLVTGCISSTITTVLYQPLELLKTRIQLRHSAQDKKQSASIIGRTTNSAVFIAKNQGLLSLWRGTGASVLRSGPGVGLYYALLNILQSNFSHRSDRPNNAAQAFYLGLASRSLVSFILLPVTVIKVRYESGKFSYPSLTRAIKDAYFSPHGWVGVTPTVLRDSLFSGLYYMCYTQLKQPDCEQEHLRNFTNGIISGVVASVLTNPIDVIKTNIQVNVQEGTDISMRRSTFRLLSSPDGFLRFFDGVVPRTARRTLIAASTWTFYELMLDSMRSKNKTL